MPTEGGLRSINADDAIRRFETPRLIGLRRRSCLVSKDLGGFRATSYSSTTADGQKVRGGRWGSLQIFDPVSRFIECQHYRQ